MSIRARSLLLAPPAICALVGLLISTLPHLQAWWIHGDPAWIADNDEVFYLQVGSQAYFNHPFRLGDPVRPDSGHGIYKPLPLLPGILLARGLGLGPIGIGPAWRIWAGVTIGIAWYYLFKGFLKSRTAAVAFALFFLTDGGILEGRPILRQATGTARILAGDDTILRGKPFLHPEWRISTPGTTMAYLIVLVGAFRLLRENPTRRTILATGIALGLLFHVYFYYWTAAVLAFGLMFLFDGPRRRSYFLAGVVGLLAAAPSLAADIVTKRTTAPDWLLRSDKFLPIGHFAELQIPWVAVLILTGLAPLVWRSRGEFAFLWCLCVSAVALMNHQIVTGLQIENFHWVYVWGPCLSILIALVAADLIRSRSECSSAARRLSLGIAAITVVSGFALRGVEADRSRDCIELTGRYRMFTEWDRRSGWSSPSSGLKANATVAGSLELVDFAVILGNYRPLDGYSVTLSSSVRNDEWDERRALNAVLLGLDRNAYEKAERHDLETEPWGPWGRGRSQELREDRLAKRLAAFDRIAADPARALDANGVRYFIASPNRIPKGKSWQVRNGYYARGDD